MSNRARLSDDPEVLAERTREALGLTLRQQKEWQTAYDALNGWRAVLEEQGVLVFQATEVEVSEMRGFSLGDETLPAVVVNIKDHPHGRVFTLLHEFVHLMLNQEASPAVWVSRRGAQTPDR